MRRARMGMMSTISALVAVTRTSLNDVARHHHQRQPKGQKARLRGEKAGDLPVQEPSKFDVILNVETAKVLGLTLPPELLASADEVVSRNTGPTSACGTQRL
jgi:hypothetical protein